MPLLPTGALTDVPLLPGRERSTSVRGDALGTHELPGESFGEMKGWRNGGFP